MSFSDLERAFKNYAEHARPQQDRIDKLTNTIEWYCSGKRALKERVAQLEEQLAYAKTQADPQQNAILKKRSWEMESATSRLNDRILKYERLYSEIRIHIASLVGLYNGAAGKILFGYGPEPDYMKMREAIEDAIKFMAKESG